MGLEARHYKQMAEWDLGPLYTTAEVSRFVMLAVQELLSGAASGDSVGSRAVPNRTGSVVTDHTPGPWGIVEPWKYGNAWGIEAKGQNPIATVHGIQGRRSDADARLIAVAPDLLDAVYQLMGGEPDADHVACRAIAKAEGRDV